MDEEKMAGLNAQIDDLHKDYGVAYLDMIVDIRDQVMLYRVDGGYVICRRGKQFIAGQPQLFMPTHIMKKLLEENPFGLEPEDVAFIAGKVSNAEFHARPKPRPGHKGYKNQKRYLRKRAA